MTPPDLEPPAMIGPRYRVLGELGEGGMGRVLEVEHVNTGARLALKLLNAPKGLRREAIARFQREARALAKIHSEQVVRIFDADFAPDGTPYIVMERLEGVDLAAYVRARGRLAPAEARVIVEQIAAGLQKMHELGLVHRDLKPSNVFLHLGDARLVVKLLDFGLVKPSDCESEAMTVDGAQLGTPAFMSPEQLRGDLAAIGVATDMWAFGMLMFRLLAGADYWQQIGAASLTLQVMHNLATPSTIEPRLPAGFDAWFMRSCAFEPTARWPDVAAQWRALDGVLGTSDELAPTLRDLVSEVQALVDASCTSVAEPETLEPVPAPRERRQVTVLYSRLAAPGARRSTIDPEDFEALETRFQGAIDAFVGEHGLTSSRRTSGGRHLFFGYPTAYGDDARRAVEMGLRLIEAIRARMGDGTEVGVGIDTGIVLSDPGARAAGEPSGPVLAAATELGHAAGPGGLVVSAVTWRLVSHAFEGVPMGPGDDAPVRLAGRKWRRPSAAFDAGAPIIGRAAELSFLQALWRNAALGSQACMVMVTGESGIGKTHLVHAFCETAGLVAVDVIECQCSPYLRKTMFHPVTEAVTQILERAKTPGPGGLDVSAAVDALGLDGSTGSYLAHVLGMPVSDRSLIERLSPQLLRTRTIEALVACVRQRARRSPVLLVVEDAHWSDPSTLAFLDKLALVDDAPLLTIVTARPDHIPQWSAPETIASLPVRRLSPADSRALVQRVASRPLGEDVVDNLVEKSDGIPLFLEELTRLVIDAPEPTHALAEPLLADATPTTLRGSLRVRLDQLGEGRALAQYCAVFGRDFEIDDVAAIWPGGRAALDEQLAALVASRLVHPPGQTSDTYRFRHALVRDAVYESLPRAARRALHEKVARWMLAGREPRSEQLEVLAHHWAEAGSARQAAELLLRAGQTALARSANAEARAHFERARGLVATLERSSETRTLEVTLATFIAMTWVVSRGAGTQDARAAFDEALTLMRAMDDLTPALAPVLWSQWMFLVVTGRFHEALATSTQLRAVGEVADRGVTMLAHLSRGTSLNGLGPLTEATEHLEAAIALYDPVAHAHHRHVYGYDPLAMGSAFRAWALWNLGYPDRAATIADAAVTHAESLRHPNSMGLALALSGLVHQYRGDAPRVMQRADALLKLSEEQGWIHWTAHAHLWAGAALILDGRTDEGVARALEGRRFGVLAGERAGASHYDAVVVDALLRAGRLDEAAALATAAERDAIASGERVFLPELIRLFGEIAAARGEHDAARQHFQDALERATAQGCRSYALRAATSLARLERERGDEGPGRAALADVFASFVEGHATADLRAARAELDRHALTRE